MVKPYELVVFTRDGCGACSGVPATIRSLESMFPHALDIMKVHNVQAYKIPDSKWVVMTTVTPTWYIRPTKRVISSNLSDAYQPTSDDLFMGKFVSSGEWVRTVMLDNKQRGSNVVEWVSKYISNNNPNVASTQVTDEQGTHEPHGSRFSGYYSRSQFSFVRANLG